MAVAARRSPTGRSPLPRGRALTQCEYETLERLALALGQPHPSPIVRLTPQQRRVAARVATGQPNKQIARELDIALDTVKNHLTAIYKLTGTDCRVKLALWWLRHGETGDADAVA